MWVPYLRDTSDEDLIEEYIEDLQKKNGFTEFYFLSREGMYRTVNGEIGYLDLKESLPELILQGENAVISSVVPGKPEIVVFAVPAAHGIFRGFEYEAIAVSFNNHDMVNALKISAFDGKASSYVLHSDGRVVVDNAVEKRQDIRLRCERCGKRSGGAGHNSGFKAGRI